MNKIKILGYRIFALLIMSILCLITLPLIIFPLYILNIIGWGLDKMFNSIAGIIEFLYFWTSELNRQWCENISDYAISKIEILYKNSNKKE